MLAIEELSTTQRTFWPGVVLLSFVTGAIDVAVSGFRALWNDESYTAIAATISPHDFAHLVSSQSDAVHATYYIVMRPYIAVAGHSAVALRAPSAFFMALACAGIMMIARSLVGARVAVFTGASFAFLPLVVGFGTEARSYALSATLATWATWFFIRWLDDDRSNRRWAWGYGVLLVLTAYSFIYALVMIIVHLLVVASDATKRRRLRELVRIQIISVVAVVPLLILTVRQHQQISWIPHGFFTMISNGVGVFVTPFWTGMAATPYPELLALLAWGLIAWGLFRVVTGATWTNGTKTAVRLALAWAIVPGVLYSLASALGPYFTLRYIVFCVPAVALLIGLALSQLRSAALRTSLIIVMIALVVLSVRPLFSSAGKDGWGTTLQVLSARGAPGEFVYPTPQLVSGDYDFDARATGLPHHMTLIDFGRGLPWSSTISVPRWSSTQAPPTHVIWLVPPFGQVSCNHVATLARWGFAWSATYGTPRSPTYKFVSPRPSSSSSHFKSCSSN
jgi:mannosyltransferase